MGEATMNWNAVGAIGEMIGALAVVVSVIYLAFQIRDNTRASMVDVVREVISAFSELERIVASTPDLAHIILRGRAANSKLSPEEALRFDSYYSMAFQILEGWYTSSSRTLSLPREQIEVTETILRHHLRHPGARAWWEATRDQYPKSFGKWVDTKGAALLDAPS